MSFIYPLVLPDISSSTPTCKLPLKIDLRSKMSPVYDQLQLGSCSANAIAAAVEYDVSGFLGSRLFLYYNEKLIENDVSNDSGALLSDGITALVRYGICEEKYYPYTISNFKTQPSKEAYANALLYRAMSVKKLQNDMNIFKNCLASGYPFVISIYIYTSFEGLLVAKTGFVSMPKANEENLGGHAILICGYDDGIQCWIGRNSWGEKWGDKGYFYIPYVYLIDSSLSSEGWCITSVGNSDTPSIQTISPVYTLKLPRNLRLRYIVRQVN